MKKIVVSLFVGIALLCSSSIFAAPDVDLNGAQPGKWTMDLDAAKKVASAKKLPLLINFSGSDWCGWCKIMEKNVFSQKDWHDYAKDNVMMVLIDFPKDSSIVPEKYVERNKDLKAQYSVSGFPTLILIDDDSATELGRLGAGRDKTPATFIAELSAISRFRSASVEKFVKTLKGKDKSAYIKIADQIVANGKSVKANQDKIASAEKLIESLEKESEALKLKARDLRAAQLGADALKDYEKVKVDLEEAKRKLKDWVETQPARNEENQKKYQAMTSAIQDLSSKMAQY